MTIERAAQWAAPLLCAVALVATAGCNEAPAPASSADAG